MREVERILDANANRSREALRVVEEAARFVLDDAALSEVLKALRHDLMTALRSLPNFERMMLARDTAGDVGTQITTAAEGKRGDVKDVVIAAGKRFGEALRAMEEYGKVIDPSFAGQVEGIRYRFYDAEKKVVMRLSRAAMQWRCCVLVSEALCHHYDWLSVAKAAMVGGADCIQLREKRLEKRELLQRATKLVAAAQTHEKATGHKVAIIINDSPEIALMSGADGVHLGQGDLPCDEVRTMAGSRLIIGVSTSCLEDVNNAVKDGADYCGVGPMFATTTKHKPVLAGPGYLQSYIEAYPAFPHLAIGGIHVGNVPELIEAGVKGIAVSSVVCNSEAPEQVVRDLCAALG